MLRGLLSVLLVLALLSPASAAAIGGSAGPAPSQAEQSLRARYDVARNTVVEVVREMRIYLVRLEEEFGAALQALRAREAAAKADAERIAKAKAAAKAAEAPKVEADGKVGK